MIALITAALQFMVLLFGEIFSELSAARQAKKAVDASNANFQLILGRVMKKIGQGTGSITKPVDDQVDGELKPKPPKP